MKNFNKAPKGSLWYFDKTTLAKGLNVDADSLNDDPPSICYGSGMKMCHIGKTWLSIHKALPSNELHGGWLAIPYNSLVIKLNEEVFCPTDVGWIKEDIDYKLDKVLAYTTTGQAQTGWIYRFLSKLLVPYEEQ